MLLKTFQEMSEHVFFSPLWRLLEERFLLHSRNKNIICCTRSCEKMNLVMLFLQNIVRESEWDRLKLELISACIIQALYILPWNICLIRQKEDLIKTDIKATLISVLVKPKLSVACVFTVPHFNMSLVNEILSRHFSCITVTESMTIRHLSPVSF